MKLMRKDLEETIDVLRKRCPTKYAVRVVVGRGIPKDSHAIADLVSEGRKQYFVLRLPRAHCLQKIYLVHEWAHCMSWHVEESEHGDYYGLCYARAYRAAFGE